MADPTQFQSYSCFAQKMADGRQLFLALLLYMYFLHIVYIKVLNLLVLISLQKYLCYLGISAIGANISAITVECQFVLPIPRFSAKDSFVLCMYTCTYVRT